MALTIRLIDERSREIIDEYKIFSRIKTDSRALMAIVHDYDNACKYRLRVDEKIENLKVELEDYKRVIAGLEKHSARVLELIKQQELDL